MYGSVDEFRYRQRERARSLAREPSLHYIG
jgi:hypothetical protein